MVKGWLWVVTALGLIVACGSSDEHKAFRDSEEDAGAAGDSTSPAPLAGSGGQSTAESTGASGNDSNADTRLGNGGAGMSGGEGGAPATTNGAGGAQQCVPLDLTGVPSAPVLPALPGACPDLTTTGSVTINGSQVQVWAGSVSATSPGPLVFYYPALMQSALSETPRALGQAVIDEITSSGGLVAGPSTSAGGAIVTGNSYWRENDFAVADTIVACAAEQLDIDPTRIHVAGSFTGAFFATELAFRRSSYVASAATVSGGLNGQPEPETGYFPPLLTAYGRTTTAQSYEDQAARTFSYYASRCAFAIQCPSTNSDSNIARLWDPLRNAAWQFLEAHPYRASDEPYAGALPVDLPDNCVGVY
jgi:hypothetical protein